MDNETSFVAPEGMYTMAEEHRPPPLHVHLPSTLPLYPTRLSTVIVKFPTPKIPSPGFTALLGGGGKGKEIDRREKRGLSTNGIHEDSQSSSEQGEDVSADPGDPDREKDSSTIPPPTSLFSPGPESGLSPKKSTRRPKHNIRTTSSSFVTRLQTTENLNKHLSLNSGDVTFLFYNFAKGFFWTELGTKAKDPLARITFAAHPTCHAVNAATASYLSLDVVIGFNTGDLIWFDPLSSRYVRLNKGGCIISSPCTAIHWVPSSRNLFLVSHADGTIIVYDKEREDSPFVPKNPGPDLGVAFTSTGPHVMTTEAVVNGNAPNPSLGSSRDSKPGEYTGWLPFDGILVTPGPSGFIGGVLSMGVSGKERTLKNPVSHWRISRKSIQCFAFSPDVRHVAVGGEDSCLRVIDVVSEKLIDTYAAYFGSITCLSWSPDGRYILAGGQDDLLTIFAPFEQRVVARCQGHSSFVSGICFDELRCNGRTYRFASVGEDNKLVLWDFSGGALHRPKVHGGSHHPRMSLSSTISLAQRRQPGDHSAPHLVSSSKEGPGVALKVTRYHPAPSRNEVAVLQPVLTKSIEGDLLSSLLYLPSGLFTITRAGSMKFWARPTPIRDQRQLRLHERGRELEKKPEAVSVS